MESSSTVVKYQCVPAMKDSLTAGSLESDSIWSTPPPSSVASKPVVIGWSGIAVTFSQRWFLLPERTILFCFSKPYGPNAEY